MKFLFLFFAITLIAFSQADDCNCRIKTNNRIINGQIAIEHSIPWIISLAEKKNHFCGGSILNEKYILTAAHCVEDKNATDLTVRVGLQNVREKIPEDQVYQVQKIHSHEYKDPSQVGDIAILELSKNIKFVENVIEKGCYNLEKRKYPNNLLAAGWGFVNQTYIDPKTNKLVFSGNANALKQAFFTEIVSPCKDYLICIKSVTDGDSPCHGDSGGPIHYTDNGITKVEGVFSYLEGEYRNDIAYYCIGEGAYSRLSYYADWINETAGNNFCGSKTQTKS